MINVKLYIAKVESTEDPDKKSRIQVRLLPEMKDAQKDHLPWVYPFMSSSMTADSYSHSFPEEDSLVWCFFTSESFHTGYYIPSVFLKDVFDYSVIEDAIDNIEEIDSPTYPQAQFTQYKDGTIVFRNTETGETGIHHSSGTYTVIDKNGAVFVKGVSDIKLYNDNGSMELLEDGTIEHTNDSGAGNTLTITGDSFEFNGSDKTLVKFEDLKSILGQVFQQYDVSMYTDPLSGVAGPVVAPVKPMIYDPQIDLAKSGNTKVPGV